MALTKKIENGDNWKELKEEFKAKNFKYEIICIPEGKEEQELWDIFESIAKMIPKQSELIIDITHGYRSLPLIALSTIVYLRQVKEVNIKGIFYGAYEANKNDITPVFDLSIFLDLIEWLGASKRFIDLGDSSEFAKLLNKIQNELYQEKDKEEKKPTHLKNLGSSLKDLSLALNLSRVLEIPKICKRVEDILKNQELREEINKWAKPLDLVIDEVKETYKATAFDGLHGQIELAKKYLQHGYVMQCATLLREWIISYVCEVIQDDSNDPEKRKEVENILNNLGHKIRNNRPEDSLQSREDKENIKNKLSSLDPKLIEAWSRIIQVRNDLAHCGMGRKKEILANELKNQVEKALDSIEELLQNHE
ncbi:TIGR02221 family CRISPR-associated protein [Candidatus Methylacidiphilum fumarolicum]